MRSSIRRKRAAHRAPAPLDACLLVDFSAADRPVRGPDSLWIVEGRRTVLGAWRARPPLNPPTRAEALAHLRERLVAHRALGLRTLVGFDFALAFPAGAHARFGLRGRPPWRALWEALAAEVREGPRNANDRFALACAWNRRAGLARGPFWGRPPGRPDPWCPQLPRRHPRVFDGGPPGLAEWRACERALRAEGFAPKPVWHVAGAPGVVGSQTLLGIPFARALRDDPALADAAAVWPFETGWSCTPSRRPLAILAEVWPTGGAWDRAAHPVKDAAQLLGLLARIAAADRAGALESWFDPWGSAAARGSRAARLGVSTEGWILGARR